MKRGILHYFLVVLIGICGVVAPAVAEPQQGIAMIGAPLLPPDFSHLGYVNPQAPKGGKLTFGVVGTFDGLNPFVIKNFRTTARGLFADGQFGSLVYETMMGRSYDEPFTLYGLLAERVEVNEARTQITFYLHAQARFSDNVPVDVDDVAFSYELLRDHGRPPYNSYMKQVQRVERLDVRSVRFHLGDQANRELALLIASSMPILPRHKVDVARFSENDLTPIPGSGPYRVEKVEAGRRIIYRRNPDYWGADLPLNRGLYNFNQIEIDYYRNDNARFEAFKKGLLDVFVEEDPNRWRQGYDFNAMHEGRVIKESFATGLPAPMVGFVFNTRRSIFADVRVRKALSLLLDFDWINRNLYYDAYRRTQGFWDGSELSSLSRPARAIPEKCEAVFGQGLRKTQKLETQMERSKNRDFCSNRHEKAILAPYLDRHKAAQAYQLLQQAGFKRQGNILLTPDGQPFHFECLISRGGDEKLALAFARSLARLGIDMQLRQVDDSQYQNRLGSFDYDMIVGRLSASLSPGTEQLNRWSSHAANARGSFNFAGVQDEAVDGAVEAMLAARTQPDFIASVQSLDRLLISGHYYIPLYHAKEQWVARWAHIGRPDRPSLYGYRLTSWWDAAAP